MLTLLSWHHQRYVVQGCGGEKDWISFAGGINMYGYVGNNLLNLRDRLGSNRAPKRRR